MKVLRFFSAVCLISVSLSGFAQSWPGTERWEETISGFELRDKNSPPPPGAILCIGSSSMANWNNTIARDLAPLTVIPRGFGGSTINDVITYSDRVVFPYKPHAILLYEGDNDITAGLSPAVVAERFRDFFSSVHQKLPKTRIYVISVKPSIARKHLWAKMKELNRLLELECSENGLLTYIDGVSPLLDQNGELRSEVFCDDQLHLNREGYALWAAKILPVLMEKEGPVEQGLSVGPAL